MDFAKIIAQLKSMLSQVENLETENGRKLYITAKDYLGRDISNRTENTYGCADSVNNIFKDAFGVEIGGDVSTYRMYKCLQNSTRFARIREGLALPGDVIISPTGYGNKNLPNGHCGIMGYGGTIMSNSSETGLWVQNFTLDSWKRYYGKFGGYPIYFFRVL